MTKVYIVEETGWDHHENMAVFSTKEKAEEFCEKLRKGDRSFSFSYNVEEYALG